MLTLVSAYPYAVDAEVLPAVLWTRTASQAAGTALARVLAEDVSPARRSRGPGTRTTPTCRTCSTTT